MIFWRQGLFQEGALPGQEAAAGYHGYEAADTNSAAEETPLALAAAVTVLDDAEMENIFGRGKGNRGINSSISSSRTSVNRFDWGIFRQGFLHKPKIP